MKKTIYTLTVLILGFLPVSVVYGFTRIDAPAPITKIPTKEENLKVYGIGIGPVMNPIPLTGESSYENSTTKIVSTSTPVKVISNEVSQIASTSSIISPSSSSTQQTIQILMAQIIDLLNQLIAIKSVQ